MIILLATAAYSSLSILRHLHFSSGAFDLGIFDQVVWLYSRFSPPYMTMRANLLNEHALGDHFHPILVTLAPLYWITDRVEALLIVQALFFALAILPIFLFTEKRLGMWPAYLFALSYALFWGVQQAVVFDFHEVAFAVPLVAFSIYFIDEKRWGLYFLSIALLLLTKENLSITVAFFGIYLISLKEFRRGIVTLFAGIVWLAAVMLVFMPYFRAGGAYHYWTYIQFGPDFSSAVRAILKNPLLLIEVMFTPSAKLRSYWLTFYPFLGLAFFSPLAILMIPLLAERFLSAQPNYWSTFYHYSAVISPVLVMASADGLARILRLAGREKLKRSAGILCGVSILLLNLHLVPQQPLWNLTDGSYWRLSQSDLTGRRALKMVPPEASVAAQAPIVSHLSHRRHIFLLAYNLVTTPDADYIIACESLNTFPYPGFPEIRQYLSAQEEKGYRRIFEDNGWIILQRP
ncbi:MAG: DUF2079 domain-containing protein [Pyrinomonadaceae bacterium]|nr:DUF2079 domain-containing protein [Pyrinomonadaceae bacterium]